jgi:site-specific recombinase XerD
MQEELEISPVTVHALRHTFATNLIKQGTDIKVVSQLLGHSSVRITYDTYVHTDLTHAIEAVNKLNTNTAIASVSPLN